MRIAIDARWIFPHISGIGAHTRELIRALAAEDRHHEYLLLFQDPALRDRTLEETGAGAFPNVRTCLFPHSVFSPRSQLALPRFLRQQRVDVFHSTNYMIPFLAFAPARPGPMACVVTIHDLIPLAFPEFTPRSKKVRIFPLYRRIMLEIARRADAVITGSQATHADILRHLGAAIGPAERIHIIHNGVSDRFCPAPNFTNRPARRPDEVRTLLYVGRADPYKNLATLIRAMGEARKNCPFPLALVVAGSPDPRYPEAAQLAAQLGLADSIRWTGYISDAELLALYRQSDLLVHPSRYEGFGLQIIEAMACGLPVVSSRAGSLAEVAGNAAQLLDPDDVAGFSQAIRNVLNRPELAQEMIRKGLERAAQFTWQQTARKTIAVYAEAAETRRTRR